jgi:outer membrane protein TolC
MNRSTTTGLLIALLLSPGAIVRAETNDALASWIDTALDKNPELAAARKKWDAARQKAPQARWPGSKPKSSDSGISS